MVAVCKRDAAKGNTFGLHCAFGIRRLSQRCYIELVLVYILNTPRAKGRAVIIKPWVQRVFVFKTMPCLTRTPSRGPFVLARTVVLVSALALLGYLPLANPLTAPSRRERPPGILRSKIVVLYSHFQ